MSSHDSTPAIATNEALSDRLRHLMWSYLQRRDVQRLMINIGIILVIGTIVHLNTGLFWTLRNWEAISVQIAVVTIVACAMTLVMIAGHIDVSVPATVVLGGIVAGFALKAGVPIPVAFILAVLAGGGIGVFNAFLVLGVGITSLIATIGTMYGTLGLANLLTNGLPIAGLPEGIPCRRPGRVPGSAYLVLAHRPRRRVLRGHPGVHPVRTLGRSRRQQ